MFLLKMHPKFGIWGLALLLLVGNSDVGGNEVTMSGHGGHKHGHSNTNGEMENFGVQSFFPPEVIKAGSVIHTYMENIDPPSFLPREVVESFPFSSSQLAYLLQRFDYAQGSHQAATVEDTLKTCESEPIQGETKFCATSLEAMLHFVNQYLAPHKIQTIYTRNVSSLSAIIQDFSIVGEPAEVPVPQGKGVACHPKDYPYTVYYCHYDNWGRRAFEVSLVGEYGSVVQALAICHTDTSHWDPEHTSFRVFGIKHGSPVCHFFPADHLFWVPRMP